MASCYWRTCYFVKLELLSLKLSRFFWKESFSFLEIIQIMNCKMLNAPFAGISVIYFKIVIHIQVFISRWEYTVTPLCVCLSVTFCHICSQQLLIADAWNFYTLFVQACHMVGTMSTSHRLCLFCIFTSEWWYRKWDFGSHISCFFYLIELLRRFQPM